ncbi:hypothetical protein [Vacuolonema iberomarrocanum]|uniref:hypothetical protein n=1 Tax=Vacuolonema iberomarrocanum TaxID=3454632 RepID=UPI0019EF460E|nr:hypothetical protein [filamentous cyanobacterium LEGE 07170]
MKNDSKHYETGVLLLLPALRSAPDIGQGLWCMKRTKTAPELPDGSNEGRSPF